MANTTKISYSLILKLIVLFFVLYCIYKSSDLIELNSAGIYIEQDNQRDNITKSRLKTSIKPSSGIAVSTGTLGNTTNNSISFSSVEKALLQPIHAAQAVQYRHGSLTSAPPKPPTEPSSGIVVPTETLGNITNNISFSLVGIALHAAQAVQHSNLNNVPPKPTTKPSSAVVIPTEMLGNINNSISSNSIEKAQLQLVQAAQAVKVVPLQKGNSHDGKNFSNAVVTKQLYDAGHDIPNKNLCPDSGASLKFLVLIMSAPINTVARMAIRLTWGHYTQRKDIGMGFVLGRAKTPELTSKISSESNLYRDIIACRFIDSYDNLTLKAISMMEWIDNYCPKVKFILKTDDDMFINIPKLISFVESRSKYNRTIFGRLARKWRPYRNPSGKWFVSTQYYAPHVFPDFTTGPAYLLTGDIVHDLYVQALNTTFLKLEDVFMTGVVAQAINIKRVNAREFWNTVILHSICNVKRYISIHQVNYHEQFDLWEKLFNGFQKYR